VLLCVEDRPPVRRRPLDDRGVREPIRRNQRRVPCPIIRIAPLDPQFRSVMLAQRAVPARWPRRRVDPPFSGEHGSGPKALLPTRRWPRLLARQSALSRRPAGGSGDPAHVVAGQVQVSAHQQLPRWSPKDVLAGAPRDRVHARGGADCFLLDDDENDGRSGLRSLSLSGVKAGICAEKTRLARPAVADRGSRQ